MKTDSRNFPPQNPARLLFATLLAGCCLALSAAQAGALEGAVAIGSVPSKFELTDIRFVPRTLADFGQPKAFVVAFTTVGCPVTQRYLPRLNELAAKYREQGVQFIAVNVGADDTIKDAAYQALEYKLTFPVVKDFAGDCVRALGAERTPEVVLLDAERKIRYRGRIDDQYRVSGVQPAIGREDLRTALDEVLAGKPVEVAETPVDGCAISLPEPVPATTDLTYAKDVAPLLNKHCVDCHHPGTAAPFSLTTYEKAAAKAKTIAEVVAEQRMPPWFAHPGFGKFVNERTLKPEERDILIKWARGGKPAGDLSQAPKPREFTGDKWEIGQPDLIVTAASEEKIPADGYIPYRYVILPYVFPHDTWIQGIQIMPRNAKVVHHANLAYATLAGGYDEAHNFLTGKVPGGNNVDLGAGVAMMIPKGAVLAFQIHYVTTGKEETDQISVGLRFAKEVIHKKVRYKIIQNGRFAIAAGDASYPVAAQKELECDATGIGLFTHMHLRGKDSTFFAHYPDGKTETLLSMPNYSFDWQLAYVWEPGKQQLPKGTKIECSSHFDNSAFNPFNPDPKATVKYGAQTHDEMMQGFFFYTDNNENLNVKVDPKTGKEIKNEAPAAGG